MPNDTPLLADDRGGGELSDTEHTEPEHTEPEHTGSEHTVSELVKMLSRALRTLGNDGHPDTASRLAAQAWVLCRQGYPDATERLNGLMHYLARVDPSPVDHPAPRPAAAPEE